MRPPLESSHIGAPLIDECADARVGVLRGRVVGSRGGKRGLRMLRPLEDDALIRRSVRGRQSTANIGCPGPHGLSLLVYLRANACDTIECNEELFPTRSLLDQSSASGGRDSVVSPASLPGLLDPPAFDEATIFEAIERRVERCHVVAQCAARAFTDEAANLVAMSRPVFHERQEEQVGAPFLEFFRYHRY